MSLKVENYIPVIQDARGYYSDFPIYAQVITPFIITVGLTSGRYKVSDYVTSQAAINAAINYVNTLGGGVVQLTAETFTVSGSIVMKDNIILRGQGFSTIIVAANALNMDIIINANTTNGNNNMIVEYLKIDGNKSNQSTDSSGVYFAGGSTHCDNVAFDNIWITNTSSMGLHPVRVDNLRITQSYFTNVGKLTLHHGIYGIDNTGTVVSSCNSNNNAGNGYNFKQGTGLAMSALTAKSNGGSGLRVADQDDVSLASIVADNNTTNGINLAVETLSGVNKCSMAGITTRNNRAIGIYISNSADISMAGMTCIENKFHGMELNNTRRVSIGASESSGNSNGANNQYSGICLSGNTAAIVISGVVCKKNGVGQQKYGFEINDTVDDVHFTGNNFAGNQTGAVNITTSGTDITYGMNKGY